MKLFLAILLMAGAGLMQGCAIIIGKHPDHSYVKRYCFPCIEVTEQFGVGLTYCPVCKYPIAAGWRYEE